MKIYSCDVMIDIECLGVGPDAPILTIAAVAFDPFSNRIDQEHSMYFRIDPESQPDRGIDDATVEWWSKQPKIAQEEAFSEDDRVPLKDALEKLSSLIWRSNRIWANGITYDMTILEHAYKQYGINLPWQYYRVMDARTVFKMLPSLGKPKNNHHAFYDCVNQIEMLQETFHHFNIQELGK